MRRSRWLFLLNCSAEIILLLALILNGSESADNFGSETGRASKTLKAKVSGNGRADK